jgi:hypothetical protein
MEEQNKFLEMAEHIVALERALNETMHEATDLGWTPVVFVTPRPDGTQHVHIHIDNPTPTSD